MVCRYKNATWRLQISESRDGWLRTVCVQNPFFLSLKDQEDKVHKCSGELETLEVEERALDGRNGERYWEVVQCHVSAQHPQCRLSQFLLAMECWLKHSNRLWSWGTWILPDLSTMCKIGSLSQCLSTTHLFVVFLLFVQVAQKPEITKDHHECSLSTWVPFHSLLLPEDTQDYS